MSEDEDRDLRVEILQLASDVGQNTEALKKSQAQQIETKRLAKRANINSIIAAVAAVVAVIAVVVALVVGVKAGTTADNAKAAAQDAKDALEQVEVSRVQQCQNGNETRKGQRELWNFIVDTSLTSNPDAPEAVQVFYANLRTYVNELFAERDCSDLSKEYTIPDPPKIPTLEEIEGDR